MKLTIDIKELAELLGIKHHTIWQVRAGQSNHPILNGLPEPVCIRPKLLWWRKDIEDWVESRRTFKPAPPPVAETGPPLQRKRGRPRKRSSSNSMDL
jgi:predicted DNA-binding transcriptional regulator AlpA